MVEVRSFLHELKIIVKDAIIRVVKMFFAVIKFFLMFSI
jgi:hypothetical protein